MEPSSGVRLAGTAVPTGGARCMRFAAHTSSLSQLQAVLPELEWRSAGELTYAEYADASGGADAARASLGALAGETERRVPSWSGPQCQRAISDNTCWWIGCPRAVSVRRRLLM